MKCENAVKQHQAHLRVDDATQGPWVFSPQNRFRLAKRVKKANHELDQHSRYPPNIDSMGRGDEIEVENI